MATLTAMGSLPMWRRLSVFEEKYPHAQDLLFGNAPSHRKFAPGALDAATMNVNPGGKQPKLHDTTWNGDVQMMCLSDGT